MTWVGRHVCGAAVLPATQGNVEADTWPSRPFLCKAGHQGRAEGQVATWLMWGPPYILRRCLSPRLFPLCTPSRWHYLQGRTPGASRGAGRDAVEVRLALHPAALPVFSFAGGRAKGRRWGGGGRAKVGWGGGSERDE